MRTLGNILWHFPFFGFISAFVFFLIGIILTATVVAAPIGLGIIAYSKFLLAPFSHDMAEQLNKTEQSVFWQNYSFIIRVLYFPVGVILSICMIPFIIIFSMTIIGIPRAIVMAKSLGTIFNPVNKICVHHTVYAKSQEIIVEHEATATKRQAELNKITPPPDND